MVETSKNSLQSGVHKTAGIKILNGEGYYFVFVTMKYADE
jgi:hypothetical protein